MSGLRMRDIKNFMWDDDPGLGGNIANVFPGWADCLKTDKIAEFISPRGLIKMAKWLENEWAFITKGSALMEKTFQRLIDQVNDRPCAIRSAKKNPEDLLSIQPMLKIPVHDLPGIYPWHTFKTTKDGMEECEPEFNEAGHANPLYVKDELYKKGRAIMMKKNNDYTGGSGDPYANFRGATALGISPIAGILLRVQDKLMRVKTFDEKGELLVQGEGVEDALIDVQNYMDLIGGMIKGVKDGSDK